jgi:hypothetical protein
MSSRKFPRIHIDCPLSFSTEEPTGRMTAYDSGTTFNLSWNGCAIQSQTPVTKGWYVQVRIALPGHDIELDIELAKVRWATQHSFGVEFLVLNEREQAKLRGFVQSRHDNESIAS